MRFFDTEYIVNIDRIREAEENGIPVEPIWAAGCIDHETVVFPGENPNTGGTTLFLKDMSCIQIRAPFRVFRRAWIDYHEAVLPERNDIVPAIDVHEPRSW